jgi:hypothetical protein
MNSTAFAAEDAGSSPWAMPGAATLLAAGTTAAIGYCVWEQIKFRMYRAGKNGYQMPGERGAAAVMGPRTRAVHAGTCYVPPPLRAPTPLRRMPMHACMRTVRGRSLPLCT